MALSVAACLAASSADMPSSSGNAAGEGLAWHCPTEMEVLATASQSRWAQWASEEADCCPLPADLVSCGPDIGPCCVKRVMRATHNATQLRRLLPDSGNALDDPSAELAHRVVHAAEAGEVEALRVAVHSATDAWLAAHATEEMRRSDHAAAKRRRLLTMALHVARAAANATLAETSGLARATERATRHAAGLRRGARADAEPIIFAHVSKAGGTAFCDVARANLPPGAYPQLPGRANGGNMWARGDGPLWCCCGQPGSLRELSCEERSRAFRERGYGLMAVERYLDRGGALCPQLTYVSLLRDPVPRGRPARASVRTPG